MIDNGGTPKAGFLPRSVAPPSLPQAGHACRNKSVSKALTVTIAESLIEAMRRTYEELCSGKLQASARRDVLSERQAIPTSAWRSIRFEDVNWMRRTIFHLLPDRTLYDLHITEAASGKPISIVIDKSYPGRPTSKDWIEAEFRRRVAAGEAASRLAEEARYLSKWLEVAYPLKAQAVPKTIENQIRSLYKELMPTKLPPKQPPKLK
jgi:hypothetical protein